MGDGKTGRWGDGKMEDGTFVAGLPLAPLTFLPSYPLTLSPLTSHLSPSHPLTLLPSYPLTLLPINP